MFKINFMMVLIALCFFTVLGILGTEYWIQQQAIQQGLQQCLVKVGETELSVIWTKECNK